MEKRFEHRPDRAGRKAAPGSERREPASASYVIGRNAVSELLKSGRAVEKIYVK